MFKQLELKISGLQKYTHKWITKFGEDCFIIICHCEQLVVIPAQAGILMQEALRFPINQIAIGLGMNKPKLKISPFRCTSVEMTPSPNKN